MRVTRTSPISGRRHTLEVDLDNLDSLDPDEHRFLEDGITPEEWKNIFEHECRQVAHLHATKMFWITYCTLLAMVIVAFCTWAWR